MIRSQLLALAVGVTTLISTASAADIDPRRVTCSALQSLIARNGFVYLTRPAFGDDVVADVTYCSGGSSTIQRRSVPTSDDPECLVNYCVYR